MPRSQRPPTLPLLDRAAREAHELRSLAPFAAKSSASLGRRWPEGADDLRTVYERDRDRIVHSTAFRRLMYKTQVFLNSEGDHNRTRLSHSLEVAQVARSLACAMQLNESLCETLALAHDIGHPPFGHRGEWALDKRMQANGGFRHNAQVLRVVDLLERRSPDFPGLNLTREVREGLLKHESDDAWPGEFEPRRGQALLEVQVVDLADSTAYDKHDIEDGLLAGMFSEDDLYSNVALWRESCAAVEARHAGFLKGTSDAKLRITRIAGELIRACIRDLLHSTWERLHEADVQSAEDVRDHDRMLVGHGPEMKAKVGELQRFLYQRFYRHEHLKRFEVYAEQVLSALFDRFLTAPEELAPWYRAWADQVGLERSICDYLAGMTDRFAEQEYVRLVGELP